jgi:hypothetical protein
MFDESHAQPRATHVTGKPSNRSLWWVVSIFAVVSLAALGLAGWAVFLPTTSAAEANYTDTQRSDAKTKICAAFTTVRAGVNLNTNLVAPGGPEDITGSLAVAANGRVALYDGGQYLLARLDPATPSDLADAVRKFANTLMDIGAGATAGLQNSDPGQAALLKDATASDNSITQLCK